MSDKLKPRIFVSPIDPDDCRFVGDLLTSFGSFRVGITRDHCFAQDECGEYAVRMVVASKAIDLTPDAALSVSSVIRACVGLIKRST